MVSATRVGATWQCGGLSGAGLGRPSMRVVFRLRHKGVRLPTVEVIERHVFEGALVCTDEYTSPQWHAVLYALPEVTRGLIGMHDVVLRRSRGGFRQ